MAVGRARLSPRGESGWEDQASVDAKSSRLEARIQRLEWLLKLEEASKGSSVSDSHLPFTSSQVKTPDSPLPFPSSQVKLPDSQLPFSSSQIKPPGSGPDSLSLVPKVTLAVRETP